MGYTELPDGTRVYDKGHRYKPVPPEKRKYRKFPKGTVWVGGKPYGPKTFLADDQRQFPATRPDEDAALDRLGCGCRYCKTQRVRRLKKERLYAEVTPE